MLQLSVTAGFRDLGFRVSGFSGKAEPASSSSGMRRGLHLALWVQITRTLLLLQLLVGLLIEAGAQQVCCCSCYCCKIASKVQQQQPQQ